MNTHKEDSLERGFSARRPARIRGTVMVFVTVAMVSCMAFAVLTMDVGMIVWTKIQLQNAADAAALAGASALVSGDQDEARRRAIAVAGENLAWRDGLQPVVIVDGDVTFPTATRCRVRTHRTEATGDALRTFFIRAVNSSENRLANASAVAEAEVFDVCGTYCTKPWSPVDKWDDVNNNDEYDYAEPYTDLNANGQWDPGEPLDESNSSNENQNGSWDDNEPYDPYTTGYHAPENIGDPVTLKVGQAQDTITSGHFYAVELDGTTAGGADEYYDCIVDDCCAPNTIALGDSLLVKPGNMQNKTIRGAEYLIEQDPGAQWDNASQSVVGSAYGTSPRVVKIALFDPRFTPKSGREWVRVTNLGAFFIEEVEDSGPDRGNVRGVYMGLITQGEECAGEGEPTFLAGIKLVE